MGLRRAYGAAHKPFLFSNTFFKKFAIYKRRHYGFNKT